MKRAWTEGPWRECSWDPMVPPHVHKDDGSFCMKRNDLPITKADAALIALAPELAEAILAWDDNGQCAPPDSDALVDLAEKLRQIGGE